ncbi:hypothetical protein O4J56_12630 [Nocardiopsis sp. RSe5-2]|uniref:DUF3558 domain-containing protein n=1 Tax=Nocardiopsis endophytica TaxID=3018445 RepID=A0ABT4U3E6_9ACTN|nr:hypothetical protein [Nocardiopsis endophytica]MDA2811479.1 hypothetical protein [Nocardiopsis endophytica]
MSEALGLKAAAAAAGLLLLAAGCGGGDGGDGGGDGAGGAPSVEDAYTGAVPAASASLSGTSFEGVAIGMPEGWSRSEGGGRVCLDPPEGGDCGYGSVQVYPKAAERNGRDWPAKGTAFNESDGWQGGDASCRAPEGEGQKPGGAELAVGPPEVTEHADGLKSHHRVWEVECDGGASFEVRMWFLPESDVMVYVPAVDPAYGPVYDQVAASMDVTEYKKARAEEQKKQEEKKEEKKEEKED